MTKRTAWIAWSLWAVVFVPLLCVLAFTKPPEANAATRPMPWESDDVVIAAAMDKTIYAVFGEDGGFIYVRGGWGAWTEDGEVVGKIMNGGELVDPTKLGSFLHFSHVPLDFPDGTVATSKYKRMLDDSALP